MHSVYMFRLAWNFKIFLLDLDFRLLKIKIKTKNRKAGRLGNTEARVLQANGGSHS